MLRQFDANAQFDLACDGGEGGIVGFALYFLSFSTWEGVHGIHLEDLYVRPERRDRGWGTALLSALAATAVVRGYARVEWSVLDWNAPSIAFYRRLGAVALDEWTGFRLAGSALQDVGARAARLLREAAEGDGAADGQHEAGDSQDLAAGQDAVAEHHESEG